MYSMRYYLLNNNYINAIALSPAPSKPPSFILSLTFS